MVTGTIHASSVEDSARLRDLLAYLRRAGTRGSTTMQIQSDLGMCAVSAAVSEIRASGYVIDCIYVGRSDTGRRIWRYELR